MARVALEEMKRTKIVVIKRVLRIEGHLIGYWVTMACLIAIW